MIAHILRAILRRFDRPDDLCATAEPTLAHLTDAAWDAHVADALAVAQSCTCDDWTADELIALAPDLVELDGVETFADFLYVTGGDVQ